MGSNSHSTPVNSHSPPLFPYQFLPFDYLPPSHLLHHFSPDILFPFLSPFPYFPSHSSNLATLQGFVMIFWKFRFLLQGLVIILWPLFAIKVCLSLMAPNPNLNFKPYNKSGSGPFFPDFLRKEHSPDQNLSIQKFISSLTCTVLEHTGFKGLCSKVNWPLYI